MELDKSLLLQKQVKDNSEDLQKEFLDLKNWEKEMKRKDEQLKKESPGESTLPPIRSKCKKKEKKIEEVKSKDSGGTKKIRSYDYSAWDKFDAEKACSELDKEEKSDESGDETVCSKEEMEKAYAVASKHKNEGNVFVQQKKWDKAIACYSQAIKLFPYDAVFYANRALCQLKLDNMYSAESDCTAALQLDEEYVKAYHRRATVRVAMKRYKDAKQDLEQVLKLEPSNKESKALLADVMKKLDTSKPIKIPEKTEKDSNPPEKLTNEKVTQIEKQKGKTEEKDCKEPGLDTKSRTYMEIPNWLPEKDNVAVVDTIDKPPHLRSKKPLRNVPVREVDRYKKDSRSTNEKKDEVVASAQTNESNPSKETNCESVNQIPPLPRTFVEFFMNWRKNTNPEFRYKYLLQLHQLPSYSLFEDLIEPDLLSEIIQVLKTEFIKRQDDVYTDLYKLTLIKRFRALIMFLNDKDKENLRELFRYMADNYKNVYGDEIENIRKIYEV